ncbi:MAG: dihydrolipoyl dehydrogenase [Gammaproteobacteria bacterium RBG_16_51_14]|nr:MAG: dihydrolipoyl dehydrogenase [Gammaproteobacteria bacterium RBG_16_51_14]
MKSYDVVVIGAGPGGYVAAIRCAQLGLTTACVESWANDKGEPTLGGTCLNVGCIPSKALLDSSHQYQQIKQEANVHGITVSGVSIDVNRMIARKDTIVHILTQGIAGLFRKHKIDWLQGHGRLLSDNQIEISPVTAAHGEMTTVSAKHIILATGSVPMQIPAARIDNKLIVDSSGALAFNEVPRTLGIIGAGAIGLELGSVWNRLGAKVIILEALEEFLVPVDRQIAAQAHKTLQKQGLDIHLGTRVTGTGTNNRQVIITFDHSGDKQQIIVDKLIVAAGRQPNTAGLGAQEYGLQLDNRGFIEVDANCRTNLPNVYAIGDVVRGPMLAHKASEEGVAVAEGIAGHTGHVNYEVIPWVIYTWPEIAWVGRTEQELKERAHPYKSSAFPFMASGRARAMGETTGMIKILGDEKTDRILGVHMFGPNASELIAEAVLAMAFDASTEDIARTIHAHPTLSEALHEAALGIDKRALHI